MIGLAVALVVLGVLVFFGQRGRSTAPTAGGPIVPGLQAALNDMERVKIAKAGGETVATIEKHADGWASREGRLRSRRRRSCARICARSRRRRSSRRKPRTRRSTTSSGSKTSRANATGFAVAISAPGKDFGALILGNAKGTKQRYARRASEAQS